MNTFKKLVSIFVILLTLFLFSCQKEKPTSYQGFKLINSDKTEVVSLNTEEMSVIIDTSFPRIIEYKLDLGKLDGSPEKIKKIRVNGVDITPEVNAYLSTDKKTVKYDLTVKDFIHKIDAVITSELSVSENVLTFAITNVKNNKDRLENPIESIEIPNHSLVSVNGDNANFIGARFATDTTERGDDYYTKQNFADADGKAYFYAFVTENNLSAGISSNSQVGSRGAGQDNLRIKVTSDKNSLSLASALWYYDRTLKDSYDNLYAVSQVPEEHRVVAPNENEFPFYAKVVITSDENNDGEVNWQDSAIAAREKIIHIPYGGERTKDIVGTRIALNFGSQAQNPFLTTLDNIKRVYLNTDGLGQGLMLKGYQNEGHDSGHPDYSDIGERMGGIDDFNLLLDEGLKYNTYFGVHINASEFYPEAQAFSDDTLLLDTNGKLAYGWQWIDQAVMMNTLKDMATGARADRLNEFKTIVGDRLDFIYVDIWGNEKSGSEDAWQTRKLSYDIAENDWRIAHEWAFANEWDATYLHWVNDYPNSIASEKAKQNSMVLRFLFNSYKDTFLPDYPHFGGAANAPLLGGNPMVGFEGWQKETNFNRCINNIFNQVLPSKFLQHYEVIKWTNSETPVLLPYNQKGWEFTNEEKHYTPEAQITLKNGDDTVVVTRGNDEIPDMTFAYGTEEEQLNYRSRVITLNGTVILKGAPTPGDTDTKLKGTMSYLIPWYWDSDGNEFSKENQKLYHYSNLTGETTWELLPDWQGCEYLYMYKLTDNGRINEQKIKVSNNRVTLYAQYDTPYVIYKTPVAPETVEWSTGTHLRDVSFIDELESNWNVSGNAEIFETYRNTRMLKFTGEGKVSQEFIDLKPNTDYAIYVGVDNRSNAKAYITITDKNGNVLGENHTQKSIAENFVGAYIYNKHFPAEGDTSYYQNMYVFFRTPADGKATLTLSRDNGDGNTYFDDVRIVENSAHNFTYDQNGNVIKFTQDFENVVQGEYPFVVGGVEGAIENRQHISELHAPYTQSGWDNKKLDDVISGNHSLKVYDMAGKGKMVYQTIPQNFRFEPGVNYKVTFDYEMGVANGYAVVIGSKPFDGSYEKLITLPVALGNEAKEAEFTITGAENGQTYFGIYGYTEHNQSAPKNSDYDNFILDNLVIERIS